MLHFLVSTVGILYVHDAGGGVLPDAPRRLRARVRGALWACRNTGCGLFTWSLRKNSQSGGLRNSRSNGSGSAHERAPESWYLVLGPSQVPGPWCIVTLVLRLEMAA